MDEHLVLDRIVSTIVERMKPRRIVLFGSRGRGEARSDSDFDLFVEMETSWRLPERSARIASLFPLHPWPMDIIVYTPDEVRRLSGVHGTLLSVIEAEGKVLYECP
jgi:predicted nucleotidyltransferase